jgi:molybdenum cofactor cytidylyltransferase
MHEVAAIMLAAGLSRRMGSENKLLLEVGGQPMVRHVARTYLEAFRGPLVVVTGFEADCVARALDDLPVTLAHNPDYDTGQPSSVATGLAHAPDAEAVLIGLADQPKLRPSDLNALLAAHKAGDAAKITIPMTETARGNPIVIPHGLRPRLTENPSKPGCMRFTREHPEHVQAAPLTAPGFYSDIDTPADYQALAGPQDTAAT